LRLSRPNLLADLPVLLGLPLPRELPLAEQWCTPQ